MSKPDYMKYDGRNEEPPYDTEAAPSSCTVGSIVGCPVPPPCSALVKQAERVLKYLRDIGEQTRGESTFPSADYADAMADDLEYALKQNDNMSGGE